MNVYGSNMNLLLALLPITAIMGNNRAAVVAQTTGEAMFHGEYQQRVSSKALCWCGLASPDNVAAKARETNFGGSHYDV